MEANTQCTRSGPSKKKHSRLHNDQQAARDPVLTERIVLPDGSCEFILQTHRFGAQLVWRGGCAESPLRSCGHGSRHVARPLGRLRRTSERCTRGPSRTHNTRGSSRSSRSFLLQNGFELASPAPQSGWRYFAVRREERARTAQCSRLANRLAGSGLLPSWTGSPSVTCGVLSRSGGPRRLRRAVPLSAFHGASSVSIFGFLAAVCGGSDAL